MTIRATPWVIVVSTKPIIHHLHCSLVQVSLALKSLPLSVYCLPWLLCPLKCACVCACPVRYPVLVLSLFCRQEKKNVSLPVSSCFSLIGIRGTHSRPECLLHVPRRNVGNKGIESGGERERESGPFHLMLCGSKNRKHPPVFSIPSASLFS